MLDLLDGVESEATQLSMVKHKPIPFPPGVIGAASAVLPLIDIDRIVT